VDSLEHASFLTLKVSYDPFWPSLLRRLLQPLRHTPTASWAKTKVSVLLTRAYLSTQDEEYGDAFWCYQQVLDLLREYSILFSDVIWHAAILPNLARLSAKLDRPDDEERYYLKDTSNLL
jgi:hypothetical protein